MLRSMMKERTSRDVMGIKESELMPGLEYGGVATFLAD
jgi:peroxiredoxin family protein